MQHVSDHAQSSAEESPLPCAPPGDPPHELLGLQKPPDVLPPLKPLATAEEFLEEVLLHTQAWPVDATGSCHSAENRELREQPLVSSCSREDLCQIVTTALRQELDYVRADILTKVQSLMSDMMKKLQETFTAIPSQANGAAEDEESAWTNRHIRGFMVTQELNAAGGLSASRGSARQAGMTTRLLSQKPNLSARLTKGFTKGGANNSSASSSKLLSKQTTNVGAVASDAGGKSLSQIPEDTCATISSQLEVIPLTATHPSSIDEEIEQIEPKTPPDIPERSRSPSIDSAHSGGVRSSETVKSEGPRSTLQSKGLDLTHEKSKLSNLLEPYQYQLDDEEGWMRSSVRRVVGTAVFDLFASFLVLGNAAFVGVQTDFFARGTGDVPRYFRILEIIFCFFFSLELSLRIFVFRCGFFTMAGWEWNCFDFIIVGIQLVEEILNLILTAASSSMPPMSALRVLRIMRLIRVVRIVRIMSLIGELRTLVCSITGSMKCLAWTVALIFLLLYTVAVFFTQVITDERTAQSHIDDEQLIEFYGTVDRTILSLFMSVTGGVDWYSVAEPLRNEIHPLLMWVFTVYIAFTVLALLNVVTGVFVESALKKTNEDKDIFIFNNVRELFINPSGEMEAFMTWDDFERQLNRPEMLEYFKAIDVDPSEARWLFDLLDISGNHEIDAEEFLAGCLRLRGPAKALDLQLLIHEVRRMISKMQRCTQHLL